MSSGPMIEPDCEVRATPWLLAALDQIEKQASVLLNLVEPMHSRLYGPQPQNESKSPKEAVQSIQGQLQAIERRFAEAIDCVRNIHDAVC